jgi:DnaJ-class molecular chaperone
MVKFEFYPEDRYNRYDNLKKNFHNLLLYFNPDQYIIKKDYAKKNYDEILNLYNLFSQSPKAFEKSLILNRISRIINNWNEYYSKDNFTSYSITLEDLYKNSINIKETCKKCLGLGFNHIQKCPKCSSNKSFDLLIFNEFNVKVKKGVCDECEGKGFIGFGENCTDCNGLKYIPKNILLDDINITGDSFRINYNNNYYTFYILPDPFFSKRDKDLVYNLNICLSDLVRGFQLKINLLNRTDIIIKSKEMMITDPNQEYIIANRGFVSNKGVGNLIIKLNVIYPKTLQEFHLKTSDNYIISEKDKFIDVYEL